jgi:hypothetical protein
MISDHWSKIFQSLQIYLILTRLGVSQCIFYGNNLTLFDIYLCALVWQVGLFIWNDFWFFSFKNWNHSSFLVIVFFTKLRAPSQFGYFNNINWFHNIMTFMSSICYNGCKTVWLSEALLVYGDMIRTILAATIDSLDELRKLSKISFFVVTHAQSCWTVVDSTKSVSAELSDFGL